MKVLTSIYFEKQRPDVEIVGVSKINFTQRKRISIAELCPNQKECNLKVIEYKRKGKNFSMPYVLIYGEYKILIDGHHTVIAKKINGQKFIIAQTYNYELPKND